MIRIRLIYIAAAVVALAGCVDVKYRGGEFDSASADPVVYYRREDIPRETYREIGKAELTSEPGWFGTGNITAAAITRARTAGADAVLLHHPGRAVKCSCCGGGSHRDTRVEAIFLRRESASEKREKILEP